MKIYDVPNFKKYDRVELYYKGKERGIAYIIKADHAREPLNFMPKTALEKPKEFIEFDYVSICNMVSRKKIPYEPVRIPLDNLEKIVIF